MKKSGFLCLVLLVYCGGLLAGGEAYVMSLPYAISEENIYKVRIEKIDDRVQSPRTRYPLTMGSHVVTVSLMLVVDWSPKIEGAGESIIQKQLALDVENGMTYQIGAILTGEELLGVPANRNNCPIDVQARYHQAHYRSCGRSRCWCWRIDRSDGGNLVQEISLLTG